MPDGWLSTIHCGIPSGTYFTQIIGSIINMVLIYMLQHHYGFKNPTSYFLGDDLIFVLPDDSLTLQQCSEFFAQFGLTINLDKSVITGRFDDIIFLGHNFYGSSHPN